MNKSSLKTLKILEEISFSKKGLTASELTKELKYPRSTIRDILMSLIEMGYITCEIGSKKVYLPKVSKLIFLTNQATSQIDEMNIIKAPLECLSKKYNDTVFYAKEENDEVAYFSKIEGEKNVRTTAILGSRRPLYCTGLGKAILSTYDEIHIMDYLKKIEILPVTDYTILDKNLLLKDIIESNKRGYSIDSREGENHLLCVAAPIRNANKVIGAISLTGFHSEINSEELKERGEEIKKVALEISEKIGFIKKI